MSIVGTRPPLISETNLYEPRHKVRKNKCRVDKTECELPEKVPPKQN